MLTISILFRKYPSWTGKWLIYEGFQQISRDFGFGLQIGKKRSLSSVLEEITTSKRL